jgi:PEP-CTERM motif
MNRLILTAILSAATLAAFGQGTIDLANIAKGTFVQPIFQPNPSNSYFEQTGSPTAASYSGVFPAGTTVYGGLPVTTAYDMVLLYSTAASVSSVSQMSVATIVPFRSVAATAAKALPSGGIITVLAVPIPGTTGGTVISFEIGAFLVTPTITAWEAANAGYTPTMLWAEALADIGSLDPAGPQLGYSTMIVSGIALGGEDTSGIPHPEPTTEEGWTSFSLTATPEPSTTALAGLGAAGLVLFRRRK